MKKGLDQLFPEALRGEGFLPHLSWEKQLTSLGHPVLRMEIFDQTIEAGVVFADKSTVLPFNALWRGLNWDGSPMETMLYAGGLLHPVYHHFATSNPEVAFMKNREFKGAFRNWQHLHTYYGVYFDSRRLKLHMVVDTLLYREPRKIIVVSR